jgi:hypothetical protein
VRYIEGEEGFIKTREMQLINYIKGKVVIIFIKIKELNKVRPN